MDSCFYYSKGRVVLANLTLYMIKAGVNKFFTCLMYKPSCFALVILLKPAVQKYNNIFVTRGMKERAYIKGFVLL